MLTALRGTVKTMARGELATVLFPESIVEEHSAVVRSLRAMVFNRDAKKKQSTFVLYTASFLMKYGTVT